MREFCASFGEEEEPWEDSEGKRVGVEESGWVEEVEKWGRWWWVLRSLKLESEENGGGGGGVLGKRKIGPWGGEEERRECGKE